MGALRSPLCSTSRTRHSGSASQPACSWPSSPWVWRGTSGGLSLTLRYDTHLPLSCPGLHFPTSDLQISVFSAFADCEVHCFRSDWRAYQPVSSCWPAEWLGDLLCDLVAESDVHCALWYKTCMSRWLELLWIIRKKGEHLRVMMGKCVSVFQSLICYKPVSQESCFLRKMEQSDHKNVNSVLHESARKVAGRGYVT